MVPRVIIEVFTMQDLIIEAIYAGIMQAKLDQRNKQVKSSSR